MKIENKITKIAKRDGTIVPFVQEKITQAIFKAFQAINGTEKETAVRLSDKVILELNRKFHTRSIPAVEEIQDMVEQILMEAGEPRIAKAYIIYRAKRAEIRQAAERAAADKDTEITALWDMFTHKSKLASLIPYDVIDAYRELLFHLKTAQQKGLIPVHEDYLGGNELAISIYENKYYLKDLKARRIEKKPEDTFARLAAFMAAVEPTKEKQIDWGEKFYNALYEGLFMPGGRVIAGAGDMYRLKTLANCFVSLIDEDNLESVYKAAYECARTYSYGGGIGVDITVLRPKDSIVHNAADSSTGSVSFMELYSLTTGLIGQSGRRGALMLTLDIKHPDIPNFIRVKKNPNWVTNQIVEQCKWSNLFSPEQLKEIERQTRENTQVRFANISIKVSDEFMQAVKEQNDFGPEKILVYKKDKTASSLGIPQGSGVQYSYGIPSKPIEKYELFGSFDSIEELNKFLNKQKGQALSQFQLADSLSRDMFGDYIISLKDSQYDLAVKKAGDFMLYFSSAEVGEIKKLVKAREIWDAFIEGNYSTAEPGLIFWTTMTKYSPSNYVGRPIVSTNPCGEVPLENGGACNLASINLSRFVIDSYTPKAKVDWEKLVETSGLVIRFLDNVVKWNESLNPLEKQRKAAAETRRLGLGVMGIADMLNQLGLPYDSQEGIEVMEKVMKTIADASYQTSAELATEKGVSPIFDYNAYSRCPFFQETLEVETKELIRKHGLRNIAMLSIAPTGTISNIALGYQFGKKNYIGVSSGIEPVFALYYTRRSESFGNQIFKVFHSTVQAYVEEKGLTEKVQACQDIDDLRKVLPSYFFRTAHHIDPDKRVQIQGICQKYVDHSISSTVNLPEDIEPEVISNIYLDAWKNGMKGITIYRDSSRYPILSVDSKINEFSHAKTKEYKVQFDAEPVPMRGGNVLSVNGRLTTVFHALKQGLLVEEEEGLLRFPSSNGKKTHMVVLSACPVCGNQTLKFENGCSTCVHEGCAFSKCDV
ncbi:MAG TPA: adenosylcobalamin-dependent ribonucleoside-diphosphate reductase [candidate division Zixibacteria bacterium]|nr:adenosylcobalamin-dependent ribonucleoside-diphosphate reductase [candidate division Zixibacteria bacterium]